MLTRAYSVLTVKSVDADQRVIEGIASTPEVDRMGDIVDPSGATFAASVPLLLHHDSRLPVGTASLRSSSDGIVFRAKLPTVEREGTLKSRIDEAWDSIREGLIQGVSIGFRAFEDGLERMKDGGLKFTKFEVLELSLVAIPANQSASIQLIKSLDAEHLAASGQGAGSVVRLSAGVSAHVSRTARKGAAGMKKSLPQQIKEYEDTRVAKVTERDALIEQSGDSGETLNPEQAEKYETLKGEIKSIDEHLIRLREVEAEQKASAKPVNGQDPTSAAVSRGTTVTVKDNVPAAMSMARFVIAKVASRLEGATALEIAKTRWPNHTLVHQALMTKATVPASLTTDSNWAGNLVYAQNLESEFLEFLRPQTIIGRITGLRRVPFNVRITGQSTGSVANWVGQGKPKPVTSFSTSATTLGFTKIAAIAVLTEESVRFSSPSLEALVRDELARAVIERKDVDFIDPAHTAVANVNPASITNGLTALTSAGTSADNVRTDLTNILGDFINANVNPSGLVLVMPNTLAMALMIMTNSLGQPEFPGMTINGGTLLGIPVVTSQYAANQSGSGNLVIAINAGDVALAEDGNVRVDASGEASIQMSDAPTNDASTGTGQSLVSMYQTNSIAVRAEQYINWAKLRSSAVVYMDDVNWGSVGSPS